MDWWVGLESDLGIDWGLNLLGLRRSVHGLGRGIFDFGDEGFACTSLEFRESFDFRGQVSGFMDSGFGLWARVLGSGSGVFSLEASKVFLICMHIYILCCIIYIHNK